MRGGSGAAGPAGAGAGANAKGNILHKLLNQSLILISCIAFYRKSQNLIFFVTAGKNAKDRKYVMTTDDLANAMADQGITVKKPPYFM